MKKVLFLSNPPRSAKRKGKTRRHRRVAGTRRVKAAQPGATMAKKRHRRHVTHRRRNPVGVRVHHKRTRRRHTRRNPMGLSTSGIIGSVTTGLKDAAFGIGGKASVRAVSAKIGMIPGTMTALLVEAGLGVVGAMALKKFAPGGARAFLQGAFMAPLETFVITQQVPYIHAYLGDGDYNAGVPGGGYNNGGLDPAVQVGMGGYPRQLGEYAGYAGYPDARLQGYPEDSMGDFDSMAGAYGR